MPLSADELPLDAAGAETLEILTAAPHYNRWQFDVIAPFLGRRILEVGAGIGNMSDEFLRTSPELLVVTDTDEFYRRRLRERFAGRKEVVVEMLTMPDPGAVARFLPHRLDTAIALNVVEHIEDDVGTLAAMKSLLAPGGRVIILVPALQAIYGELDRQLGHFRRYGRATLDAAFRNAGLHVERMFWFNRVGVLGWWFNGRVRKITRIPIDQLRGFDRLVPLLRLERYVPLPFGQSLIAVGKSA